jgi:hypothetical protein
MDTADEDRPRRPCMYSRKPVTPLTVWLVTLIVVGLCVGAVGVAVLLLGVEPTEILAWSVSAGRPGAQA